LPWRVAQAGAAIVVIQGARVTGTLDGKLLIRKEVWLLGL
jgi:hypothetical protein